MNDRDRIARTLFRLFSIQGDHFDDSWREAADEVLGDLHVIEEEDR